MSTTQAHVESKIRIKAAVAPKAKFKSAGAVRMARLRREKKQLLEMATQLRAKFFNEAFDMLAKSNPNGSSLTGARMIKEAWLEAAHLPPSTIRESLAPYVQ